MLPPLDPGGNPRTEIGVRSDLMKVEAKFSCGRQPELSLTISYMLKSNEVRELRLEDVGIHLFPTPDAIYVLVKGVQVVTTLCFPPPLITLLILWGSMSLLLCLEA